MTTVSPLTAGWRCACPRCGEGKLFSGGFLKIAPSCSICGLDLSSEDTADGPAVFLIFLLGFLVTPAAVVFGLNTTLPAWVQALIMLVVIVALTLATIRPLKAYTVALQYKHRRADQPGDKL